MRMIAAAALALSATAAHADMIVKESPHSVAATADRLVAAVEKAGAKVFARVDHAAGAQSIGAELAPTELVMFGNPRIGTPILQENPAAGVDLPLRVVVYEGPDGETRIGYHAPSRLAADHGVASDSKALKTMTGALDKLTSAAIAE